MTDEHTPEPSAYWPLVCGTRRTVMKKPGDYRVVCATCGAGGTVKYPTHQAAGQAAVANSARPCGTCGAD